MIVTDQEKIKRPMCLTRSLLIRKRLRGQGALPDPYIKMQMLLIRKRVGGQCALPDPFIKQV